MHVGAGNASRVALVQGASRGLGLAMVRALLGRRDVRAVVATARDPAASAGLADLASEHGSRLVSLRLDARDETSIAAAATEAQQRFERLHLLVNAAGVLHGEGLRPEKKLADVDPSLLRHAFEVNAFGPLLVAKHFLPQLRHEERAVLANVSARVGSIEDNRLGGWYAYRASKAAQNMFTKTLSIELRRRAPNVICVALHPGTVDTELSRPFQRGVPDGKLFGVDRAASQLLRIVDGLTAEDGGSFLAWDGKTIPW